MKPKAATKTPVATTSSNRNIEFDQFPAELLNGALVYKTTNAGLTEQGIGGTVDLRTVRPLAFGKQAFAVNVRGDQNRVGDEKENGYRASVSYIDQFADTTIGLALGYAHLNNPGQAKQFGDAWGYDGAGLFGGGKKGAQSIVPPSSLARSRIRCCRGVSSMCSSST